MNFQGFGGNYQQTSGGGGFMSPGMTSPGMDSSQKKKNRAQTLLPVTAAMIDKAEYNVTEDMFRFNGADIHQVTFVGVIREVQETATNISYKIDDMTGNRISVKKWIDNDDPLEQSKRSECREDTYVRVVGSMKSFNDGQIRSVMAFSMVPVTDFNEITFHFIDVIHAQLTLKKTFASDGGDRGACGGGGGGMQGMSDPFGGGMNDAGLEGPNKVVFNFISACTAEQGISIQELKNRNRNMSEQQLRNCLEWLSNEGHIYSTIDDDHYKSTSS